MNQSQDKYRYSVFRCLDPNKVETGQPWYPYSDICPCNPDFNNPTGRGKVACGFGVQTDQSFLHNQTNMMNPLMSISGSEQGNFHINSAPVTKLPNGNLYPKNSMLPPQLQPRQLIRIGEVWRSAN